MTQRHDFVMLPRGAWAEVFERYGPDAGGLLAWLTLEAQFDGPHVGKVFGNSRTIAHEYGCDKDTLLKRLTRLRDEVEVHTDRGRDPSYVRVVRYRELAGLMLAAARSSEGSSETSSDDLGRPNAVTRGNGEASRDPRLQDSAQVRSARSARSAQVSRRASRERAATSTNDNPETIDKPNTEEARP